MTKAKPQKNKSLRLFWMKQLRQWHWISAAICMVGMLMFAATGLTLNHADLITAEPKPTKRSATLPAQILARLSQGDGDQALPVEVSTWLKKNLSVSVEGAQAEWSADEVYVSLPIPGGDASLTVDRESGEAVYDKTTRGWVAYLNDLHKGRNTGAVWKLFIDVFAAGCVIFTATGLGLLYLYADGRKITWPLVGAGFAIPAVLALIFIH